jgi:hypothetical protein
MLDSSSCMLVRSEETQPWRADDALESMIAGSLLYELVLQPVSLLHPAHPNVSIVNIRSRPAVLRLNLTGSPRQFASKPATSNGDDERRTARVPPDHPSHLNSIHRHHHITHNVSPRQEVPRQSW